MIDLVNKRTDVVFGKDNVIVPKFIAGIKGGRALVADSWPHDVIPAGTLIYKKDGDGCYYPLSLDAEGTKYDTGSLASDCHVVGVLYRSILKSMPAASIMTLGQVNIKAMPYIEGIESEVKQLLLSLGIDTVKDEAEVIPSGNPVVLFKVEEDGETAYWVMVRSPKDDHPGEEYGIAFVAQGSYDFEFGARYNVAYMKKDPEVGVPCDMMMEGEVGPYVFTKMADFDSGLVVKAGDTLTFAVVDPNDSTAPYDLLMLESQCQVKTKNPQIGDVVIQGGEEGSARIYSKVVNGEILPV